MLSPRVLIWAALVLLALAAVALLVAPSGSEPPGASFERTKVFKTFLNDREGVSFVGSSSGGPEAAPLCTTLNWKFNGGYRNAFVHDRDFSMEIRVPDVPKGAAFCTGFGIDKEEHAKSPDLSAGYEIRLDGRTVVEHRIPSFQEERSRVWYDARVDLSACVGKTAVLRLEARVDGRGRPIRRGWSDPRVMVPLIVPWKEAVPRAPNVLVVLVDTLRSDRLGCYGYDRPTSPNLDELAQGGLLFENALAPSSWTSPSTASLLTGQYPLRHGVIDMARNFLMRESLTLAEACLEEGMYTGAFIANQLISKAKNFDQGFVFFSLLYMSRASTLTDAFLEWLAKAKDGRFMAYIHYLDPHYKYDPPGVFRERFVTLPEDLADDLDEKYRKAARRLNRGFMKPDSFPVGARRYIQQAYDGEIAFWDSQFKRVIDALEGYGLMDRTLVVVTSDHGEAFLEHGKLGHGWDLFEETVRVPLLFVGPGIAPGRVSQPVDLTSVMPTVLAAANIRPGGGTEFDGVNLLDPAKRRRAEIIFLHTETASFPGSPDRIPAFALQRGEWKFLLAPARDLKFLYNLKEDPGEKRNLIREGLETERAKQMEEQLRAWIREGMERMPDVEAAVDEETKKALEALGYVGD